MQNTNQEKQSYPMNQDFILGKKLEGGIKLSTVTDFKPEGDQPEAIKKLISGIKNKSNEQVLLGVTGSGKTFTMAKIIEELNRPSLILAPNKTLAAQLYGEMKSFFPDNAVEYFVSYYDYYIPEAYVPRSNTYIEKEASINEQIDRMRHSATQSLLERKDVVIVASVSCIYGIGSVETYRSMTIRLEKNQKIGRNEIIQKLITLQYNRNDTDFHRGTFRVRGDLIEVFPSHYEDRAWKLSLFGDDLESISEFDPLTGKKTAELETIKIYANSHYVTPRPTLDTAIKQIRKDLEVRIPQFKKENKLKMIERIRPELKLKFLKEAQKVGHCPDIFSIVRVTSSQQKYLSG